jgi:hypothetical protein
MDEIYFTHPLGYGVCFIMVEIKEHVLKGLLTRQDNETIRKFRI